MWNLWRDQGSIRPLHNNVEGIWGTEKSSWQTLELSKEESNGKQGGMERTGDWQPYWNWWAKNESAVKLLRDINTSFVKLKGKEEENGRQGGMGRTENWQQYRDWCTTEEKGVKGEVARWMKTFLINIWKGDQWRNSPLIYFHCASAWESPHLTWKYRWTNLLWGNISPNVSLTTWTWDLQTKRWLPLPLHENILIAEWFRSFL